jgi:glutamate-1-semialdehyde 2,1-aminomutase
MYMLDLTSEVEASAIAVANSQRFIPGGVSSVNRLMSPSIAFSRGKGSSIWDSAGKEYIDFHAGFAPFLLGHNQTEVNNAVIKAIEQAKSLFGSGPVDMEGELAALLCNSIDALEKVTFLNTGSEATALAIKLSRAVTGRDHIISIQGSYNGNSDELASNVFNTLEQIGPRVSPGEYPLFPLGAGTLIQQQKVVHNVNFNDLDSIRYVSEKYPVAAVILEPVLQNVGVICPAEGYLQGLRELADLHGFLVIHDEVKTGFRQGVGGYSSVANVMPDLVTYGKAVANGFPIGMLGGKAKYMDEFVSPDISKRPLLAGTYNGHPVGLAASIATVNFLIDHGAEVYGHLEKLGKQAEDGMNAAFSSKGIKGVVARLGSAMSFYFMDHLPVDFHDLLLHHDFDRDLAVRRRLVEEGVFVVPVATKQISISSAHTERDIEMLVKKFEECLI